jgi:vacuolar-type H+-ATPase subunit E/Vma4
MSLEKILEKIDFDGRQEVEAILKEARQKAGTIKKEAEQKAKEQAEAILKQAEVEARLEASRIVTQAQLQKRMELLKARRALIDQVLLAALQKEELKKARLKKEIVTPDGLKQEDLPLEKLLRELGQEIENEILEWLKV